MASTVLTGVAPKLPIGTSVGAYPAKNRGVEDSPPTAAASATATVATDGSLTFTGLTEGAEYVAAALVSGKWQKTQFWGAWDPTSPQGALGGDFSASEAEILNALASHNADTTNVHGMPDMANPSGGTISASNFFVAKNGVRGEVKVGADNNGVLELGNGGADPGAQQPFIDFHFAAAGTWTGQDYNFRIINGADGQLTFGSFPSGGSNVNILTLTNTGVNAGGALRHTGTALGFYNAATVAKQTVSGSRGANAALASLLTALANLGLVTDSSS